MLLECYFVNNVVTLEKRVGLVFVSPVFMYWGYYKRKKASLEAFLCFCLLWCVVVQDKPFGSFLCSLFRHSHPGLEGIDQPVEGSQQVMTFLDHVTGFLHLLSGVSAHQVELGSDSGGETVGLGHGFSSVDVCCLDGFIIKDFLSSVKKNIEENVTPL